MATSGRRAICLVYLTLAALAAATAGFHRTLIRDEAVESREEELVPGEPELGEAISKVRIEPAEAIAGLSQDPPPVQPATSGSSDSQATVDNPAELRRQEDEILAEKLYNCAREKMHASEFQSALEDLEHARGLDPGSSKIRDLYNEVSRIIHRVPGEWDTSVVWGSTQLSVRIAQTRVEVENHMQEGDRAWYASNYGNAEREYQAAVSKLKWLPYDIGMDDTLSLAKSRAEECRRFLPQDLGLEDFSDGTAIGGFVDPEMASDVVGEVGLFTREHYGGAVDFYDPRMRSASPLTDPLVSNIPDFPIGTRLIGRQEELNQGMAYVAPKDPSGDFHPAESSLSQGLTYAPPPEP